MKFNNKGYFGMNRLTSIGPLVTKQIIDDSCTLTQQGEKELKSLRQILITNQSDQSIPTEFVEGVQDLGLVIVGEGSRRVVMQQMGKGCVIKMSKLPETPSNEAEVRSYYEIKDEVVAKYFNPVLDWTNDFGILTQRKADSIGVTKDEALSLLRDVIIEHGYYVNDNAVSDNYGKFDERVMMIDYGHGIKRVEDDTWNRSRKEVYDTMKKRIENNSRFSKRINE